MELRPQVIKKNGRAQFVVLSCAEYEALCRRLADADDLLELRKAKRRDDPSVRGLSLDELRSRLGLKSGARRRRQSKGTRHRANARRGRS